MNGYHDFMAVLHLIDVMAQLATQFAHTDFDGLI